MQVAEFEAGLASVTPAAIKPDVQGASIDGDQGPSIGTPAAALAAEACATGQPGPLQEEVGVDPAGGRQTPAASGLRIDAPLVIASDATLLDGLRILLVHHLKRSAGSPVLSLSASQAELLEHHLGRLASYAVKIVHTLAFAARFSARPPDAAPATRDAACEDPSSKASTGPFLGQTSPAASEQVTGSDVRPAQKTLKLNDREIMKLYRAAQNEAAIEADWRGIDGPSFSMHHRDNVASDKSRSGRISGHAHHITQDMQSGHQEAAARPPDSAHRKCLQMLSRAMQQPGFKPGSLAAEIVQPPQEMSCCKPRSEIREPLDAQRFPAAADHFSRSMSCEKGHTADCAS